MRLESPRVYVLGGGYEYIRLMWELGYNGAKGLLDADFILFTGGEDVDPSLYGEAPLQSTYFSRVRDDFEMKVYKEALEVGIPMVGICRGGQFLNVANGGAMWQHVNNHTRSHMLFPLDDAGAPVEPGFLVTSTHHQMMRPHEDGVVLAVAAEATELQSHTTIHEKDRAEATDVEVVWYPETGCLCFQPHPEMKAATEACRKYFDACLETYLLPWIYDAKEDTTKEKEAEKK